MEYLSSALVFFILVLLMWALGRKAMALFGFEFSGPAERSLFSIGIGFGIIAYIIFALGAFGILYARMVILALALCFLLVLPEIKRSVIEAMGGIKSIKIPALVIGIICLIPFLGALAPSYSNDSMVYHLVDAKHFAQSHSIGVIANDSTNALWPYLVEMYFTLAVLFRLLPLAGLAHYLFFALTAMGVYLFSKKYFGIKTAILAAAVFILTPGIFMEAKETYVDLGMVFYGFTAFYSFFVWLEKRSVRWLALAGAMCGLGMSVKYFTIFFPVIFTVYLAFIILKERKAEDVKGLALFLCCAFFTSFIWYLRQYIITGNPLFPFYYKLFGSSGLDKQVIGLLSEKTIRDTYGLNVNIKNLLILPWQVTLFPHKFGGEQIGPIFLAVLPALALVRPVDRNIKKILVFSLVYVLGWFFFYQNLRFLLPVIPLLSICVAYTAYSIDPKDIIIRRFVMLAIGVCLGLSLILCIYHNMGGMKAVFGLESKDAYLAKNERSYGISEYINKNLPEKARILVVNESHTFFIDKPNKRELYYWIYTRYDKKFKSAEEVAAFFRSQGFTHILYADANDEYGEKGSRLTYLMKDEGFKNKYLRLIYEFKPGSKNAGGITYSVYEI